MQQELFLIRANLCTTAETFCNLIKCFVGHVGPFWNRFEHKQTRHSSGELVSHPLAPKSILTYCNMCIRIYHCLDLSLSHTFYILWNGLRHQEHPSKAFHKGQVNSGAVPEKTGHSSQCIHRKLELDNFFNGVHQLSCHKGSVATSQRPKANIYAGYVCWHSHHNILTQVLNTIPRFPVVQ